MQHKRCIFAKKAGTVALSVVLGYSICFPSLALAEECEEDAPSAFEGFSESAEVVPSEAESNAEEPNEEEVTEGASSEALEGESQIEYVYDGIANDSAAVDEVVEQANKAAEGEELESSPFTSRALSATSSIENFSGDTRFDTAAMIARAAYASADTAIIAADGGWPDALAGASLAGLMDCPILLTSKDGLSAATRDAIADLGVSHVVVLGGPLVISDRVISDLKGIPGMAVERLAGETRQDTQMLVYEYGKEKVAGASWSDDTVCITSGYRFPDALSFSPLAFRDNVPIFLVDESGDLDAEQKGALLADGYANPVVLGGYLVMSDASKSFAGKLASASGGSAKFIAGDTQYDTSAQIASWLASSKGFSWNGAAFTTGNLPYDALTGSVLQGSEGSVILVVDHSYDAGVSTAAANKGSISGIKFFGGELAVPASLRTHIVSVLSENANVSYRQYGVSYSVMLSAERTALNNVSGMDSSDKNYYLSVLPEMLDPSSFSLGNDGFYQFAILTDGHSGLSVGQLNSFIATNGSSGMLSGQGSAFVEAANAYGVNEAYLLSHAILESAWGKSDLAKGFYYDGKTEIKGRTYPAGTYYNFFGIGAYDSSPLSGGRSMAVQQGWDSPRDAILGAAKWISEQYLKNGYGPQNTLYRMKWDIFHVEQGGSPWKQYATATTWATSIASVMSDCYGYCGKTQINSGLKFEVPVYSS